MKHVCLVCQPPVVMPKRGAVGSPRGDSVRNARKLAKLSPAGAHEPPSAPVASVISSGDEDMLCFVMNAWEDTCAFESSIELPTALTDVFVWMGERSAEEAMICRETVLLAIERDAERIVQSGEAAAWFEGSDEHIKLISKGVNGPLFHRLLRICNHSGV